MFHRTRDAIEAHLTIVFTALAISRENQARTGLAIRERNPTAPAAALGNHRDQRHHPDIPTAIPTEKQGILDAIQGAKLAH
jgi:hypothetical protein